MHVRHNVCKGYAGSPLYKLYQTKILGNNITIVPRHLLKCFLFFFQAVSHPVGFIHTIQKVITR